MNVEGCAKIFNEGDEGDFFYIVLEGEVEILKANKVFIDHDEDKLDTVSGEDERILRRTAYIKAFQENFNIIFWPFMDISKKGVEEIFDLQKGVIHAEFRLKGQKQERMLDDYIRSHEKSFVDQGKPYIYVSLRLVCLGSGFGFGELALMKDIVRMASVRTTCTTTLATMSKKDFG
jgi:CRP-like cAMP-binding protein